MKLLPLLTTLLLVLTCYDALACASARQSRIFPLSASDNDVYALHIRMERTDTTWGSEAWYWSGDAMLVTFDMESFKIKKSPGSLPFRCHEDSLEQTLALFYKIGLGLLNKTEDTPHFQPASITMCNFALDCAGTRLNFDFDQETVSITYEKASRKWDVTHLAFNDSNTVLFYPGADLPTNFYPKSIIPYLDSVIDYRVMTLGSVREYKWDDRTLLVMHLGTGESFDFDEEGLPLPPKPAFKPDHPKFDRIEHCVYDEPVLYHGTGVDIAFWVN